jgi:hypothetical protein
LPPRRDGAACRRQFLPSSFPEGPLLRRPSISERATASRPWPIDLGNVECARATRFQGQSRCLVSLDRDATMFFPLFVAMLVRESRTSSAAPVIAVVATTVALSAPVTTAVAPAGACAQVQQGAVRKALGTSKLIPRRRTQAWRSHATFGPRWQRFAPRFHAALRDSELFAAPALSRWLVPGALSTMRQPREQFSRPVVSSTNGPARDHLVGLR